MTRVYIDSGSERENELGVFEHSWGGRERSECIFTVERESDPTRVYFCRGVGEREIVYVHVHSEFKNELQHRHLQFFSFDSLYSVLFPIK